MQLRFDLSPVFAVALGGGGARGGYEIGVWKALAEAGFRYSAVSGTSVGALNGALMTMRDLKGAIDIWENIDISQVINIDDEIMRRLIAKELKPSEFRPLVRQVLKVVRNGGFDVTPLRNMLRAKVDPERIRASDVEFFIITYSLSDMKLLELRAKLLGDEQICDMLLASAYLPAFKNVQLGGKRYTDGGVADEIPISILIENGYKHIIAIGLNAFGVERMVKIPPDVKITQIAPSAPLGSIFNFTPEQSCMNMQLGYYDAQRIIYGLCGSQYYIDRVWDEEHAYGLLMQLIKNYDRFTGESHPLRQIHEKLIPRIAKTVGARGDYYDILLKLLEYAAVEMRLERFKIYTDSEFYSSVVSAKDRFPKLMSSNALKYLFTT